MCHSPEKWGGSSFVRYRQYSPTALTNAYISVHDHGSSVRGAAKKYGVPEATLRRRVNGTVRLDVVKSGVQPVLSLDDEEAHMVNHLEYNGFMRVWIQQERNN